MFDDRTLSQEYFLTTPDKRTTETLRSQCPCLTVHTDMLASAIINAQNCTCYVLCHPKGVSIWPSRLEDIRYYVVPLTVLNHNELAAKSMP